MKRVSRNESFLYYHGDYPDMTFAEAWEKRMENLSKQNRVTRELFIDGYIGSVYQAIKCGSFDLGDI